MNAPRMRVSIVSAGAVGTAIGEKLAAVGHRVDYTAAPATAAENAQLLVLDVADSDLEAAVAELLPHVQPRQIVLHTAASHGVGVLQPLAERGALTIAAHPAMILTDTTAAAARLDGCGWGVSTRDELAATVAELLITEMNGHAIAIAEQQRELYAAAMTHGSHHAAAIAAQTAELLEQCMDVPTTQGAQLLSEPLMQHSMSLALKGAFVPAAPADAATVERQLAAIGAGPARDSYVALTRALAAQSAPAAVWEVLEAASTSEEKDFRFCPTQPRSRD
ncbi:MULTISPECIES: DUF2520 domain-containing protein [Corynebacterium]|uniref:DUF2520 domain-containing protein n=1 Tax=Corynebacterium TaxID=1716 RepID=UPI00124F52A9|nr:MULTISPECIES: DUF2520 domain-containing protein [Corynebacterium]